MNHLLALSNQNKPQNHLGGLGHHQLRRDPKVLVNLVHPVDLAHQLVPIHPEYPVRLVVLEHPMDPMGPALLEDQLFLQDPVVPVNQSNHVHPVVQLIPKYLVYPRGLLVLAGQLHLVDPEDRLKRLIVRL